jgi:glycosyltransferase involved in cell wall biosynthesis
MIVMSELNVSILMITYNHENYIREAIEGVLMQKTDFKIELVIGEDFSTDRTREIVMEYLKKYPEKIKVISSETNVGAMANELRTLKACQGKYIAFCDGDDYWTDPNKLQKQVDFLETHPDYVICFHNVQILKNQQIIDDYITRKLPSSTDIYELAKGNFIHTPSVVFKASFIKELPNEFSISPVGDYFLYMLLAQNGRIWKFDNVMAIYRIHDGGIWSTIDPTEKCFKIVKYLDLMVNCFKDHKIIKILQKRRNNLILSLLLNSIKKIKFSLSIYLFYKYALTLIGFNFYSKSELYK